MTGLPRILVIGSAALADSMESHVLDSLEHLGIEHAFVSTDLPTPFSSGFARGAAASMAALLLREPERLADRRIIAAARGLQPDLVISILGNRLSPKSVALLRRHTTAPIVCWCQDQLTTLGRQYLLGSGYDVVFVKDLYMLELFTSMLRASAFRYLPEACNVRVHRPVALPDAMRSRYACDISMIGSVYYYRQDILQQLSQFNLKVWGRSYDWMIDRLPGRLMGREVVLAEKGYAALAASISLNTLHYAEINGLNCRAFELAGFGAFQMVTHKPVLAEHFVPDEEIVSFGSADELLDKVRYYLERPELRARIGQRAHVRAHRDHSYEARLREIVRVALDVQLPDSPGASAA
jgi:spore maturation protein CgeB